MQHNPKLNPVLFSALGNTFFFFFFFFPSQNPTVLLKVWNFFGGGKEQENTKIFLFWWMCIVSDIDHKFFVLFRKFTMTKL